MSQGGESINGDLDASYYDNNGGTKTSSSYYNATNYYNYDVQMPAGHSNGPLWIDDAPFCASDSNGQYGTVTGGSTAPDRHQHLLRPVRHEADQ